MDWQTILNLGVSVATGIIGWFASNIWQAHKELRKELHDHRVEVARDYVSYTRFSETMGEVREMLKRIESRLDK